MDKELWDIIDKGYKELVKTNRCIFCGELVGHGWLQYCNSDDCKIKAKEKFKKEV
jgi:hypothetical protein